MVAAAKKEDSSTYEMLDESIEEKRMSKGRIDENVFLFLDFKYSNFLGGLSRKENNKQEYLRFSYFPNWILAKISIFEWMIQALNSIALLLSVSTAENQSEHKINGILFHPL